VRTTIIHTFTISAFAFKYSRPTFMWLK